MGKKLDLINQRFGKLLVVSLNRVEDKEKFKYIYWNCMCDCGKVKITHTWLLRSGRCKSCGCLLKIASNKEENRELAIMNYHDTKV